jgi:tetratricopeptide (TPR) repeat protein
VIDVAERWLLSVGHSDWRSSLVFSRAVIHYELDEYDVALALAEEALALYRPSFPGFSKAGYQRHLGACLHAVGRYSEAEVQYQAIVDSPETSMDMKCSALGRLARCALADGRKTVALRYANSAVRIAEQINDLVVGQALGHRVQVLRAMGDLTGAWESALRQLELAKRVEIVWQIYEAARDSVDVALDRGDLDSARSVVPDLERYAENRDKSIGRAVYVPESAQRRRRLTELERDSLRNDPE